MRDVTFGSAVAHHRTVDAQRQELRLVGVAQHVAGQEAKSGRRASFELERHRVVHRPRRVLDDPGAAEQVRVDDDQIGRQPGADRARARCRVADHRVDRAVRIRVELRERVDERRAAEVRRRVERRIAGAVARHAIEVGQEDRQRRGAGAGPEVGERAAAAGGDIGLQVGHGELELVEKAALEDVQLVVIVGPPVVLRAGADVARFDRHRAAERAGDAGLPGVGARHPQVRAEDRDVAGDDLGVRERRRLHEARRTEAARLAQQERQRPEVAEPQLTEHAERHAGVGANRIGEGAEAEPRVAARVTGADREVAGRTGEAVQPAVAARARRPRDARARRDVAPVHRIRPLAFAQLMEERRLAGERARLEDVVGARHAEDVRVVADRVAVVERHERELQIPAHAEIERQVRTHAPRVLRPEAELALPRELRAESQILVLIVLIEARGAAHFAHAARQDRVERARRGQIGVRRPRKVRRREHRIGRIALDDVEAQLGDDILVVQPDVEGREQAAQVERVRSLLPIERVVDRARVGVARRWRRRGARVGQPGQGVPHVQVEATLIGQRSRVHVAVVLVGAEDDR